MEKQHLTPAGVQHVVDWLYSLNDLELEAEALVMNSNIVGWILDHFSATRYETSFLEGLTEDFCMVFGGQVSRTVLQRWPIEYDAASPNDSLRSAKWIKSKEENEVGEGGPPSRNARSGSLKVQTGY